MRPKQKQKTEIMKNGCSQLNRFPVSKMGNDVSSRSKRGYLLKCDQNPTRLSRHYAVLSGNRLSLFEDDSCRNAAEIIDLSRFNEITPTEVVNRFKITPIDRKSESIIFISTSGDTDAWIEQIRNALSDHPAISTQIETECTEQHEVDAADSRENVFEHKPSKPLSVETVLQELVENIKGLKDEIDRLKMWDAAHCEIQRSK